MVMPNSLALSQKQQNGQTILLANKRYVLFEVIASTALATFYHATDTRTLEADQSASRVVVGIVNPILGQINGFTNALPRVLDEFTDPAVTPYIDEHGSENGQYWFSLPNLKGTPLHSYISQTGRFGYPVPDTLNTVEHIIQAVRQSPLKKEFGYLEPGAIYYETESGRCTLLNSPIAITLNIVSQSSHGKELNRPTLHSGYLSPEVALGKSPSDYDDCFSVAVIAYQMLNGHLPFVNDHTVEAALKKSIPAGIAKLEPESSQVVLNALSFQREQRPSSAEELLYQIQNPPPLAKEARHLPGWIKISGSAALMLAAAYGAFNYAGYGGQLLPSSLLVKEDSADSKAQLKLTELQGQYEQEVQKLADLKKLQQEETQRLSQLKKQQEEESQRLQELTQQKEQASQQINSKKEEIEKAEALALQQQKEEEAARLLSLQKEKEEKARKAAEKKQKELQEQLAEIEKQREAEERRVAAQKQREAEEHKAAIAAAREQREAEERRAAIAAAQQQQEADERRAAIAAAQKQREAEERRAAIAAAREQREAEERRAAIAAAREQREAEERRAAIAAAQKQREAEERRAAIAAAKEQREADERRAAIAAAQKQREADERRAAIAAAQKQREAEERRAAIAAAQKQREAEERRAAIAAAQKQQDNIKYPIPFLIKKTNARFLNPKLFGPIPPSNRQQADQSCISIGGIKALGFHPKAINLQGGFFASYYCAFSTQDLQNARFIAAQPASTSPRLVNKVEYFWNNSESFSSIPGHLQQTGNTFCQSIGFIKAIGYHPKAINPKGTLGGYLCQ